MPANYVTNDARGLNDCYNHTCIIFFIIFIYCKFNSNIMHFFAKSSVYLLVLVAIILSLSGLAIFSLGLNLGNIYNLSYNLYIYLLIVIVILIYRYRKNRAF